MKMFSMFVLALSFVAADAAVSEAGPLRNLVSRLRHRHGVVYRVVHREGHLGRRCEAEPEPIPAPKEIVVDEVRYASADE